MHDFQLKFLIKNIYFLYNLRCVAGCYAYFATNGHLLCRFRVVIDLTTLIRQDSISNGKDLFTHFLHEYLFRTTAYK